MRYLSRNLLVFSLLCLAFAGCRKKAWDEYYSRPESLEPPIYQTLESRGNFTSLLAVIDKSGYKNTLGAAGYWTFFAPHDSAFQVYFTANGLSGADGLDSADCRKIVTYCLVYNAFEKARLGDEQGALGWVPNNAFRRRTASYSGIYNGEDALGNPIKIIASNRNNNGVVNYVDDDNNHKYVPYFVNNYMSAKGLTAADYNYFYPNTSYTGFNVADAIVTEQDIYTENGIVHVINKVITALPSIDEYIGSNPDYSVFKELLDKFMVQYFFNQNVTSRNQKLTGHASRIYTKVYNPLLAFSLNNENFLAPPTNDGQSNSYSIFVPNNATLQPYINNVLLEHYNSLEDMPPTIISDFLNAHLWQNAVWPSKFSTTLNFVNEDARFNPAIDIVDKKILSNGIFYGTSKVQDANVFSSVFGKAYLDPKFSMMVSLLNLELKSQISDIYRNYTIFMISNDMFNGLGYYADASISNTVADQWRFETKPGSTIVSATGAAAKNRLLRIINSHVIPNRVINSLVEEGVAMSYGGEYIGFKNNTVFASGNVDSANVAINDSTKTGKNGRVYYIDRILEFSESAVGRHIENIGTPTTSEFNYFWQYLKNSSIWNNGTKAIAGVAGGTFYTLFIPSNAAVVSAVNDGVLPGVNGVPNFTPSDQIGRDKVINFIYYHFLDKRTVASDGVESGAFPTLLKDNLGNVTTVFVNNSTAGSMYMLDMEGRRSNIVFPGSNYLSNRCVIHLTDNYLKYVY